MRGFADLVARRWHEPDAGIWEIRGDAAHHVHSKLMGWLALDRALRIADTHRLGARQRRRWQAARDAIAAEVRARGFDPVKGSLHPQLRLRPTSTRRCSSCRCWASRTSTPPACAARSTPSAHELSAGGPLLYRYPPGRDGLPGTEGAFLPCSFWLVQALARTGRRPEAVELFQALLEPRQPARPLRRGDGPRHRRPPRQLPADADPRRARPSRPRHPGRRPPTAPPGLIKAAATSGSGRVEEDLQRRPADSSESVDGHRRHLTPPAFRVRQLRAAGVGRRAGSRRGGSAPLRRGCRSARLRETRGTDRPPPRGP